MGNKPESATASTKLQYLIPELDVDAVGIASLAEWEGTELEKTALKLLPQVRSVVVLAMEIYPEILDLTSPKTIMGAALMNDLANSHADFINGRLIKAGHDLAKALHRLGLKALPLPAKGCPIDERFMKAVFSFKHAAQAAGLGKIGWSSLLITPSFGPRVRLSACLTEAVLEPTASVDMTLECGSCGICIKRCSSGALARPNAGEPYIMNKFACRCFLVASGGCSECMRVCPVGR